MNRTLLRTTIIIFVNDNSYQWNVVFTLNSKVPIVSNAIIPIAL